MQTTKYTLAYGGLLGLLFVVYLLSCIHFTFENDVHQYAAENFYPKLSPGEIQITGYTQKRIQRFGRHVEYNISGTAHPVIQVYELTKEVAKKWSAFPGTYYFHRIEDTDKDKSFQLRLRKNGYQLDFSSLMQPAPTKYVSEEFFKDCNEQSVVVLDGQLIPEARKKLEKIHAELSAQVKRNMAQLEKSKTRLKDIQSQSEKLCQIDLLKEGQSYLAKHPVQTDGMNQKDIESQKCLAVANAIQPIYDEMWKLQGKAKHELDEIDSGVKSWRAFRSWLPPEWGSVIPTDLTNEIYFALCSQLKNVRDAVNSLEHALNRHSNLVMKLKSGRVRLITPMAPVITESSHGGDMPSNDNSVLRQKMPIKNKSAVATSDSDSSHKIEFSHTQKEAGKVLQPGEIIEEKK